MQVSYFVLYVSLPCLVGLAAEINKSNQSNQIINYMLLLPLHSKSQWDESETEPSAVIKWSRSCV